MKEHEDFLSTRDYSRICALVYAEAGIHLGTGKKTMLEARVKRRLKALQIESYKEYCDFVFDNQEGRKELPHLIDVVTTNKTDFFREPGHFDFLASRALPELMSRNRLGRPLTVWSAGCSSGEEPYTLAIVLSEYGENHPGFRFRILATDICSTVLNKADRGVYTKEVVSPIPAPLKRKYLLRSRDPGSNLVRVTPELRRTVEFRQLNFMDDDYRVTEPVDAIFCRNVIIYFDRPTQERILRKLARCLAPSGYLFVGHSETLHDMDLPVLPVAPALYRRIED